MFNNSFATMITILTFNTLSVVIDGIFIGRGLGVDSTKAFGLASPLVLFLTAVAGLFSSGCQALCMNNMGAGNHNEAKEVFSTTFVDVVIISVILTILPAFFPQTVAVTLGARGNLVQKASEYIWGYSFGIPSILITGVFLSLMQIEGKNKLISISILLTTITNLAGDFINIVYLKGGLFGMGLTTTISSYFSLAIVLHFYLSKKSFFSIDLWKYRFNHNKDIISLGMPTAALRTCKSLNAYTLNLILVFIGSEIGVAALSVVNNIILMFGCICPAVGLSAALIAAALYGEENKTGLVDLLKHSMKIGILCSVILSVTLFVFADSFVSLFIKDPSAVIETAKYLRIAALGQPLLTINQCLANMYQSMKKKKMSTVLRILEAWGFILVSALILSRFWGEKGVFIALPVGEVMSTLFILIIVAINKKSPREQAFLSDFFLISEDVFGQEFLCCAFEFKHCHHAVFGDFCGKRKTVYAALRSNGKVIAVNADITAACKKFRYLRQRLGVRCAVLTGYAFGSFFKRQARRIFFDDALITCRRNCPTALFKFTLGGIARFTLWIAAFFCNILTYQVGKSLAVALRLSLTHSRNCQETCIICGKSAAHIMQ